MGKGNLFMGYGRGKVGSVVFSRSKGQQITRAYNEAPKNPRSDAQMLQRSVFASAVKFFSQGRQALFQFAFEGKGLRQSDYNAFVSENAKRGMNISQEAYNEATYPVLAPWIMTKGTLPEFDYSYSSTANAFSWNIPGIAASANWGAISQQLINNYGLQYGDIITIVTVNAMGSTATNTPAVSPEKRQSVTWQIKQATIDVASTETVGNLFGMSATAIADNVTFIGVGGTTNASGACVIVSRNTEDGLKVNTSGLSLNAIAAQIFAASQEAAYIGQVLVSWKSSGKAILQGSLLPDADEPSARLVAQVFTDAACTQRPVVGSEYKTMYLKFFINQGQYETIIIEGQGDQQHLEIYAPTESTPDDPFSVILWIDLQSDDYETPFTAGSVITLQAASEVIVDSEAQFDFYQEI